jgi:hypothetical protein
MLSLIWTALTCCTRCCSGLMICSTHLDESATRVKSCVAVTSLCTRHTVLKASLLIASVGNEMPHITVAAWRSPSYKYLIRSPLKTISHFFSLSLSCLGFPSLVLCFPIMEGKRGIKRERSSPTEGSPAASNSKTPPPAPSGTPSPPGSPTEVSSRRPRSPVFEQGGPSRKALVIDMSSSSDEEGFIVDTSHNFEFA